MHTKDKSNQLQTMTHHNHTTKYTSMPKHTHTTTKIHTWKHKNTTKTIQVQKQRQTEHSQYTTTISHQHYTTMNIQKPQTQTQQHKGKKKKKKREKRRKWRTQRQRVRKNKEETENKTKTMSEKKKVYSTRYSQAVTHPSTNLARRCLTSVIGREPVFSTWYGRRQHLHHYTRIYHTATVNDTSLHSHPPGSQTHATASTLH